jgi:hypothetical protein
MGLALIRGRFYYFKSIRRGGKATSEYRGSGDLAVFAAVLDEEARDEWREFHARRRRDERERAAARKAQREARRALGERLDSTERIMAEYFRRVCKTVESVLTDLGYHRHARGQWRRRRNPMSAEPAEIDVRELARRAEHGDRIAIGELAYHASRVLKPVDPHSGELARAVVEPMLIGMVAEKYDPLQDAAAAKLEALRRELAPRGSSVAERLLAERSALGWLHTMILERDRAELLQSFEAGHEVDHRQIAMVDQCLSRASARLERALLALGRLKRLKLPIVVNQVNVGGRVNSVQLSGE